MKKMLFVTGSGGHATELIILYKQIRHMDADYCYEFLLERDDPFTKKQLVGEKVFSATTVRGKNESLFITFVRSISSSLESIIIFFRSNPDIIISAGPGIAIPISYLGRFFGRKIIFIESWSRVDTRSIAGRFIYPIANQFYVQWPDLIEAYPKAIYKGRLG